MNYLFQKEPYNGEDAKLALEQYPPLAEKESSPKPTILKRNAASAAETTSRAVDSRSAGCFRMPQTIEQPEQIEPFHRAAGIQS